MHLRALCTEVRRVLPEVVYYLDQKERTAKIQQAMRGPSIPTAIECSPKSLSKCCCRIKDSALAQLRTQNHEPTTRLPLCSSFYEI